MYQLLITTHNVFRWFVLALLIVAVYKAYRGKTEKLTFTKNDNRIRHYTATILHIQLMVGMILYFNSPIIKYFWHNSIKSNNAFEFTFFSIIHSSVMLASIVVITIGSAITKRKNTDVEKFNSMFWWYLTGLILIVIFIPWPFSPFAHRPYLR